MERWGLAVPLALAMVAGFVFGSLLGLVLTMGGLFLLGAATAG